MKHNDFEFAKRMAKAIAGHFGNNCEVIIHDLRNKDISKSIIAIENGHISGRKVGDGPSKIVLESILDASEKHQDRISYLARTSDGKVLKSSTVFMYDDDDKIIGLIGINYDISSLIAVDTNIRSFTLQDVNESEEPESISLNVSDLLDELLIQSDKLIGKPPALMNKEEKVRAIKFLNDNGAFLITKSGPKVCEYYGISTYTLYSYLDEIKTADEK